MNSFDNDVMLDLETTGIHPGCGILSIGACTLDLKEQFYTRIDHESGKLRGLEDFNSTMAWWHRQSREAYEEAFSIGKSSSHIVDALIDFSRWIKKVQPKAVWGNGANFDNVILQAAYRATRMPEAYKSFDDRCYRTLKNLYPQVKADPFEGTKHNALADAIHQARHCHKILSLLRG